MSDGDAPIDDSVEDGPRDSRLEAFLRQASAIIAAEKGLNNAAKAKLDDLANRLHLPDELFERGLRTLQDSNSPVGNLTDYEQAFLDFLVREFSQKPKGFVLSISIEEKAIAHAKNRFGITSHRAEQLIDYQSEKSGIGRLARTVAREYGRQMILDLVGEKIELDEESETRIFRTGRRWGCKQDEVEALINDRIAENSRAARIKRLKPLIFGTATFVCLVLIGVAGWWLFENRESIFGKPPVAAKKATPIETGPPDTEPESKKSALEVAFPDLESSLNSEDPVVRGDAFEAVANEILSQRVVTENQISAIQAWYSEEPDPLVINRFVQAIDAALSRNPESIRSNTLQLPYRAAKLILQLCDSPKTFETGNASLTGLLERRFGFSTEAQNGSDSSTVDSAIAARQWNWLIQNSWRSPGRSSIVVEALFDLTQPKLSKEQLQPLLSRCVRAIILADRTQWRNMTSALKMVIESADEVQRMEWIDIWLDDFDGTIGFRELTGPILVKAVGANAQLSAREHESFLRSARSDQRNRRLLPALTRHKRIEDGIKALTPRARNIADANSIPDLIFQTSSLANLCLEAADITGSGRASDEAAWTEVDLQLKQLDSRLRDFVYLDDQTDGDSRVSSAGFDTSTRDRTLLAFADLSDSNQASRLAAIERLPGLTQKFESISNRMALTMATYLVSTIEPDEWLQMQRVLPELAKWPRVTIAIADRLPESNAPIDQLLTMYGVLVGQPWDEAMEEDWRSQMSVALLKFSRKALIAGESIDPNSSSSDWIRLEKFLLTNYRRRSQMLGDANVRPGASVVEFAKRYTGASIPGSATDRGIALIEGSTNNELEQIVLLNQLTAESTHESSNRTMGQRLLESEMSLLRKWNESRQRRLKAVLNER